MASFTRWYVSMLKTRPMLANCCSAAVLMTAGDVLAQELEHSNVGDTLVWKQEEPVAIPEEKRSISLKRYGTVSPKTAQTTAIRAYDETKNKHKHGHPHASTKEELQNDNKSEKEEILKNSKDGVFDSLQETITQAVDTIQAELEFWDGYRTSTMIVWSAGVYTPLYVQLYRVCDRLMPTQTPVTIFARVLLSFVLSVPINTAFFTYGVFVHHSAEWLAVQREWSAMLEEMGISPDMVDRYGSAVPYDPDLMWKTARLKLESELVTTVVDSAKVWIPINILNFTITPPHLRPVILLSFSVFWNAYLSLAQHRDLSLPGSEEDKKA